MVATSCADETGNPDSTQMDTASYRMVFSSGDVEDMYTQAEVDAQGIAEGELMIAGMMNPDMGMDSAAMRHLEVSICDLATGAMVTGASAQMTLNPSSGAAVMVPVAEMRGLDEPPTMAHYGNNVSVPMGSYTADVSLKGETAQFPMAK